MSRRKLFKPVMMTAGLCLTMWQLPQMLGAIDAAKDPRKMSKFLDEFTGGKSEATSGVSALMPGSAGKRGERAGSEGDITIYSASGDKLTDAQRQKLLDQARRNMPRADASNRRDSDRSRAGKRKTADETISDAMDELNKLNPR